MTTLHDIANRLCVSPGLVSGVLNGKSGVRTREETRQRILETAREMGYRPSAAARALVTGKTRQIAVVIGEADLLEAHPGTMHELRGIMEAAHALDYRVLVVPLTKADLSAIENLASSRMCDGFCLPAHLCSAELAAYFAGNNAPYIVMGDTGDDATPRVDHDNSGQYFDSVTWLAAQGHQRIGLAVTNLPAGDTMRPFHRRILGSFDDAMKKRTDLAASERRMLCFRGEQTDETIAAWVRVVRPTAVIVYGVWRVLQWKRVLESAPDLASLEILILGHVDVTESHHLPFREALHGLALNLFDSRAVGYQAASALLGQIEGRPVDLPILLPSRGPNWWQASKDAN